MSEYEALCPCVEDIDGKNVAQPDLGQCRGTGVIDANVHPDFCNRCGMTGYCPDCGPKMPWED